MIRGEASADGKETNLQITDRETDIKEPAGLLQTLSWELPHLPCAHTPLTQPCPHCCYRDQGPNDTDLAMVTARTKHSAGRLPQLCVSVLKPFRMWGTGIAKKNTRI